MRIAWLTDQHGIFVDRDAWELALTLVQKFKPHAVPVGSDDIDFYRLSKFDKNPDRRHLLQDELDYQAERHVELKDAVDPFWNTSSKPPGYEPIQHPTILGNHNDRLFKTVWNDPKFFRLRGLAYPSLLEYERFGFTWKGDSWDSSLNKEWSPVPGIVFTHGSKVSPKPGYSVQNEMASRYYDASLFMGHCHRGGHTIVTKPDGTQLHGIEGFCLCDLHPEYAKNVNWTQGITLVTIHESGIPEIDLLPFTRDANSVITHWRGQEFRVPITSRSFIHA